MTEDTPAAPRVGKSGGWRRLLANLAVGLTCSATAIAALYAITHLLLPNTQIDWFLAGCAVLVGIGCLGALVAGVWSFVAWMRHQPTRSLLTSSFVVLALVAAVVVAVMISRPIDRPDDAQTWAGYQTTRNGVTQVAATWRQPRAWPSDGRRNSVFVWAGLTYPETPSVVQIGTQVACARHMRTVYRAWYELYPADLVSIPLSVRPGDLIAAEVVRVDQDHFRLALADTTTGRSFST
ncbi:MAG TPA: G1 family glutamic endopeptidase, partial [Thermoleophilia bacterium]|nr:G1 family glutamic endopeptidase [Thermoleophilia bacterium]